MWGYPGAGYPVSPTFSQITVAGITNTGGYTQSGTTANTFTGTPTFSNATYSALFTGGNTGFGTAEPSHLVHVRGSVPSLFVDNSAATANLRLRAYTTGADVLYNGVTMIDFVNTTTLALMGGGGNVGIGTSTFGTSAAKVLALGAGTAPSTSPADVFQVWVQDPTLGAGYASIHWRDEIGKTGVIGGLSQRGVTAAITASTTQTQGQGALIADINEISVCANVNDTVTLPSVAGGMLVLVVNNGAQTLQVFPASGDNLGAGVNTATTIAAASRKLFVSYDATNWEPVL